MSRVADMNCKGFSDSESKLLESVDRRCWGRVGLSVETPCLCELASLRMPFGLWKCVMFWYIEVVLDFIGVNVIGFVGWVSKRNVWRIGTRHPKGSIAMGIRIILQSKEAANDGIASGGGVCNVVHFVFASNLLFFLLL